MKRMKENSPLQDMCPEKRLSNHSVWKMLVRKLKDKGVPKSEIIRITDKTKALKPTTLGTKTNTTSILKHYEQVQRIAKGFFVKKLRK